MAGGFCCYAEGKGGSGDDGVNLTVDGRGEGEGVREEERGREID